MIKLVLGDITKLDVQAIVNAANSTLLGGGGVDGAIHRAAGPQLLAECRKLGGCEVGQAKITAGYNLPAKYVIHTVGPIWRGGHAGEAEALKACYENSLRLAAKLEIKTIAFPAISTGVYRYPLKQATKIAINTVKEFVKAHPTAFEEIVFVSFSQAVRDVYYQELGQTEVTIN